MRLIKGKFKTTFMTNFDHKNWELLLYFVRVVQYKSPLGTWTTGNETRYEEDLCGGDSKGSCFTRKGDNLVNELTWLTIATALVEFFKKTT